jgi:hypothetical protein
MQPAAGLDSNNLRPRLLVSVANPLNCPRGVLCDQWLRVGCRTLQRGKIGWIAHIAERDTHIA